VDIIRSATLIGTEVVRREGELGIIAPGAIADLLVVDGIPLEDLKDLTDQGACMPITMKDSAFVKNMLEAELAHAVMVSLRPVEPRRSAGGSSTGSGDVGRGRYAVASISVIIFMFFSIWAQARAVSAPFTLKCSKKYRSCSPCS
jgi:hypothetical protein